MVKMKGQRILTKTAASTTLAAMLILLIALSLSGLLLRVTASPSAKTLYPWPMCGNNPQRTKYTESPAPTTNETLWTFDTGGGAISSPAVADGMVFIGGEDSTVYAINALTGELVWSYSVGSYALGGPAVADGMVFAVSWGDGVLHALDEATGEPIWSYTTGGLSWDSSPAVVDGVVFVASDDANVYALDAETGELLWSYTTGGGIPGHPAVDNGMVFVQSSDGYVYALNKDTGELVWTYAHKGIYWYESPAVADGMVFIGELNGVTAIDEETGEAVWSFTGAGSYCMSPAVGYGKVFVSSFDRHVYALDAETGELVWNYTTVGSGYSGPALAGGMVFAFDDANYVYALDAETGELVWNYLTNHRMYFTPAIADGILYIGTNGARLYAIGTVRTPTASFTTSPAVPLPGETATFNASESSTPVGSIVSWEWDFGDGTTGTGEVVNHTYDAAGEYNVTLTVTNDEGFYDTIVKRIVVTEAYVLTVEVSWSNGTAIAGVEVTVGTESGTTDATGKVSFTLGKGRPYDVKVKHGAVDILEETLAIFADTIVKCTVDASPYATIADLEAEVSGLEATASTNLYGGLGGGFIVGLIIGLAVMFLRRKS